ncbi:SNW domain-containing protein 1-like [Pollicipes pollicipes]|uniref:SNW domain-containing protein 1-like n=1 Tax=Pollicipes pollicipes TaxID=41117 RepID=UPI001885349F|nr:SNW domain-containing protein 1-like [Pollicipes pollicipes]
MESLQRMLPAPSQRPWDREQEEKRPAPTSRAVATVGTAPPYGQRASWMPRNQTDFGNGGAFPECHVAQFPLGMGAEKSSSAGSSNVLAVQLDAQGKVKYDVLARQGHAKDKIVYSKYTDLLPSEVLDEDEVQRPDDDEIRSATEKTQQALEKITNQKISAAMPVQAAEKKAPAQYIRYTPSQQGVAFNSGAKQRVIRMVEMQKDPMEPPKFKINSKIPRGPPSPPAPVMHSPTRKVTVKEQQDWKIPPCISNWKNAKGYTIPLDKRLAADGRGLQQVHINENFAKLAESLYIADRKSREAVEMRAQLEKRLAQKEKERKEETLRELAKKAREERAGIRTTVTKEDEAARERDALRQDRHKDRARERNLARTGNDKRSKQERQRERDISEQIALGLPARPGGTGETQFDQRLFNQSRGMDSGFNDEDAYNVYDKPWGQGASVAQAVYRPGKNVEKEVYGDDLESLMKTNRFVPDKGFEGADRSAPRSGPVQFERQEEFDPFGIDQFLTKAKQASKRPGDERRDDRDKRRRH